MGCTVGSCRRLVEKAKIRSHDDLASAIDTTYKQLKGRVEGDIDLDAEIKVGSPQSKSHELRLSLLSLADISSSRSPAVFGAFLGRFVADCQNDRFIVGHPISSARSVDLRARRIVSSTRL